uniref:Uncharacterized protein n=1 Tax=Aotus nancymaae TaxID=37293 RepID=A0A2K5D6B9_AOTNA
MSPSSEGRPLISGVSVMAQVRSGPPRGAGWGPQTDLSLLAPLSSTVQNVGGPLFISHAGALASRGVTVEGCPKLILQSVLSRSKLSCVCVCVCSTSVCAGCASQFLSSVQTHRSEQMSEIPSHHPPCLPSPLWEKQDHPASSPTPAVYLYRWKYTLYFVSSCL